jgi:cytochrome c peroxidase
VTSIPVRWSAATWRRSIAAALLAAAAAGCDAEGSRGTREGPALVPDGLPAQYLAELDTLTQAVVRLDSATTALEGGATPERIAAARDAFHAARARYKQVEYLVAYFEPSTAKSINGPALPRVEDEEGPETVFPPEGFQVVEEQLWGDAFDTETRTALTAEVRNLGELLTRLRTAAANQPITEVNYFDAAKLAVARVVALGITGFDSPVALASLPEAAASLRGLRGHLRHFRGRVPDTELDAAEAALAAAEEALDAEAAFEGFDRLGFIVAHANPVARAIVAARTAAGIPLPPDRRAFRLTAATLFDADAWDPMAFAPLTADSITPARAALGHALFFDGRLSSDGQRSCASCHLPALAFTDGRARSAARTSTGELRNAPTIINAGLQQGAFYDGRVVFLEDQVTDVVGNVEEMHGSLEESAQRLRGDAAMRDAVAAAYPGRDTSAVNAAMLRHALATYIRATTRLDSRVDQAWRGDTAQLSAEERLGFNVFAGKAKCATCHFLPLTNGTVPPFFAEGEVEVLGVPSAPVVRGGRVDPDLGRFLVTRAEPHRHAFRTPGVRNVALTAPYMHNGVYRTLEQVVDFYNRGGGAGIGIELPNQTLPPDPLNLSTAEQRALVAFLRALTDTTGTTSLPQGPTAR